MSTEIFRGSVETVVIAKESGKQSLSEIKTINEDEKGICKNNN